jgi:hypothetical protein
MRTRSVQASAAAAVLPHELHALLLAALAEQLRELVRYAGA